MIERWSASAHVVSLGFSEVAEQVSSGHQLHDDVEWVVVDAYAEHFDDILVIEITRGRQER